MDYDLKIQIEAKKLQNSGSNLRKASPVSSLHPSTKAGRRSSQNPHPLSPRKSSDPLKNCFSSEMQKLRRNNRRKSVPKKSPIRRQKKKQSECCSDREKFSLFNMTEKEKVQMRKDLYSPIFHKSATYRMLEREPRSETTYGHSEMEAARKQKSSLHMILRGMSRYRPRRGFTTHSGHR